MSLPLGRLPPPVFIQGLPTPLPICPSLTVSDLPEWAGFRQGSAAGGHRQEAGGPLEKPGCVSPTSLSQVVS